MLHVEIICTFILSPPKNHYLQFTAFTYSLCVFPVQCERSAHYSQPAAKHFPRPRRRRRMALVSPCPLGDVQHPTYPKIDAQDNEKCQMWQSTILLWKNVSHYFPSPQLPPTQGRRPTQKYSMGTFIHKVGRKTFSSHVKDELFCDNHSVDGLQNILPRWVSVSAIASHKTPS